MTALKRSAKVDPQLLPRLRVTCGGEIALGPGKVELLEHVAATGSIAQAASQMDMSYMRAWTLIKTMNGCFHEPLVETARGGTERGGAELTDTGRAVIALYREMEAACRSSTNNGWRRLQRLLKN